MPSRVEFKAPFDFAVGDRKLPLGTYQITREGGSVLLIRSRNGASAAFISTSAASTDYRQPSRGEVVFNRYGNQYFMHESALRIRGYA
jgi:hypothetical protein